MLAFAVGKERKCGKQQNSVHRQSVVEVSDVYVSVIKLLLMFPA